MTYRLNTQPLISEKQLSSRIKELGREISGVYGHEDVVVVAVLKGSFIFTADLIRHIDSPLIVEFIGVSSYSGTSSTGQVRITHDLSCDIEGRHVLLVEDIVDTGETLDYLSEYLLLRKPKTFKVCSLLSKPMNHKMAHHVDFIGFEIGPEFVVGYGLDVDGRFRQIPYLARVETE